MVKEIYVIIAGSREFNNYELLTEVCDHILENKVRDGYKITIISGHADGADSLGEKYASQRGYDLKIFPAEWKKYALGQYLVLFLNEWCQTYKIKSILTN